KPDFWSMLGQRATCQRYSLKQVKKATGSWAKENLIGSGGYGEVYRGVCPHEPTMVWAVKRAKILANDFKREVEEMASKSHPHLVRLLGYCVDMDMMTGQLEQIVIYEFCLNGDLEKYLSGGEGRKGGKGLGQEGRRGDKGDIKPAIVLLDARMQVQGSMVGGRGGEGVAGVGDIKPANVLLNALMRRKVSEFGLVRVTATFVCFISHPFTRLRCQISGCYGVMLLEVITTIPVILSVDGNEYNIKDWIRPFVEENDVAAFKDPRLPEASSDLLLALARIGLECTALPPSSRPSISDVVRQLETLKKEHLSRSHVEDGGDGDLADVDHRVAQIDQELDRRAESIQRLDGLSEIGAYRQGGSGVMRVVPLAQATHPLRVSPSPPLLPPSPPSPLYRPASAAFVTSTEDISRKGAACGRREGDCGEEACGKEAYREVKMVRIT
ncbi:unnamed protein product, partial [Closterium sp. Naga37s-1]